MYTDQEDIVDELNKVWPVICIFSFIDCIQYGTQTGIKAAGKQGFTAIFTGFSYCVIGLTTSWILTFKFDMGLTGIWIGSTITLTLNFFVYLIVWLCMDLETLIDESEK